MNVSMPFESIPIIHLLDNIIILTKNKINNTYLQFKFIIIYVAVILI